MKRLILYILGILLLISSCQKDDKVKFVLENDPIVKYFIELNELNILSYAKYIENELIVTTTFYDYDSIIERITKNASNEIVHKISYTIGDNNFAISACDTNYSSIYLHSAEFIYEYENNFLREYTGKWKHLDSLDYATIVNFFNEIENNNITSKLTSVYRSNQNCNDKFTFNNYQNLIDIRHFSNNITGNISQNLIEHAIWRYGCPCGPSSSVAYSDFMYEFDSDGFVTKTTEIYTPCYHLTSSSTVTRHIKTTVYEYNKQ